MGAEARLTLARHRQVRVEGHFEVLTRVADRPAVAVVDGILDHVELNLLCSLVDDVECGVRRGPAVPERPTADGTGSWFELVPEFEPMADRLVDRIHVALALPTSTQRRLRMRRYRQRERHVSHYDHFVVDGNALVITAMVCLEACDEGGETVFPLARPNPVAVPMRAGRMVAWANHLPSGEPDPLALHEGALVRRGTKTTATWFVYADPARPFLGPWAAPP